MCNDTIREIVNFKDKNFEEVVRIELKKDCGCIFKWELLELKELEVHLDKYISNMEEMKYMKNLEKVTFLNTEIKNIDDLKYLEKLKSLTLNDISLKTIGAIKELKSLECLNITRCEINDFEVLNNLKWLKSLMLCNVGFSDFNCISELSMLEELDVEDEKLKTLDNIEKLRSLKYLTLSLYDFSNSDIEKVNLLYNLESLEVRRGTLPHDVINIKCPNLRILYLHCDISKVDFLCGLSKLEGLYIKLHGVCEIKRISQLSNLKYLAIAGGLPYESDMVDITPVQHLNNLKILMIIYIEVSNLQVIGELKGLEHLYVAGCNINCIDFIKNLDNLISVCLAQNKIKNLGTSENFENLKKLEFLELCQNNIENVEQLIPLKNLKYLDVSYNNVKTIKPLLDNLNLDVVQVRGCEIETEELEIIKKLPNKGTYEYYRTDYVK